MREEETAPSNSLLQTMRRHPLLFYFLMAFGFTWAYGLLVFVVLHAPYSLQYPGLFWVLLLTLVGPTLATFLMTAVTQGRAGILQLLRRYVRWRVGISWYLIVFLGVPALLLIAYLILPGALAAFHVPGLSFWPTYLIAYLTMLVFGGPLGEEPGWRGFALPRLQQHTGPLMGTLLLGVLWALWHLPIFFIPGTPQYAIGPGSGFVGHLIAFFVFVINTIALTVIFTWVFNNTRGSLLLAILLHASSNTAFSVILKSFPSLPVTPLFVSMTGAFAVVALLVLAATRGRLSYQRYLSETARPAPVTDRRNNQ